MPSYTTMKTWAALAQLTAAELNTYLRDNMEYVKGVLDGLTGNGVQLRRTSDQSIPDSAATLVTLQAVSFELQSDWWTSGTNVTVPVDAIPSGFTSVLLLVNCRVRYSSNGTGVRRVRALLNGTAFGSKTIDAFSGDDTDIEMNEYVVAVAGDVITMEAYQTSGGSLNLEVGNLTVLRLFPAA